MNSCTLEEGKVILKSKHKYYIQVQGQIGVTGMQWCDFVMWCGPGQLSVERVKFDPVLWGDSLLSQLVSF